MKSLVRSFTGGAATFVLSAFLLAQPGGASTPVAEDLLPAGEPAPMFEGVRINNKPFSLEEELTRGPVLLVFWSIF